MQISGKGLSFMFLPLALSLLIAIAFAAERLLGVSFVESGIYPRTLSGLKGILFGPFIHGDLAHLLSNLSALPVLLGMLALFYRRHYASILAMLWIATGLLVWLMARSSYHIGASGVIYAVASFLLFGGLVQRRASSVAASLLVVLLYGSMVWGILPEQPHVSWESHLLGGVAGFACAFAFEDSRPARAMADSDFDYRIPGFSAPDITQDFESVNYESSR